MYMYYVADGTILTCMYCSSSNSSSGGRSMYWNHSFITTFQQIFTFKKNCPHFFLSSLFPLDLLSEWTADVCRWGAFLTVGLDPHQGSKFYSAFTRARTNIISFNYGALTKQYMPTNTIVSSLWETHKNDIWWRGEEGTLAGFTWQ